MVLMQTPITNYRKWWNSKEMGIKNITRHPYSIFFIMT
jgi:hypothetical protein